MSILRSSLSIPTSTQNFSSLNSISGRTQIHFLTPNLSHLHLTATTLRFETMKIRMGGGPRTYPGGVSKWQWKRMQSNKAKQLLKARLARERQIYEMRKRAELKAAVSELERPWEVVEKAPNLFSVGADEQLKVLADRFQRPGGFDMWSDRDGPELFKSTDGVPSARFFPKGVVHSIKPYGKIENSEKSSTKPKQRNHSQAHMNAEAQRHVVDKNRGNSVNGRYLADSSENNRNEVAGGEIRQKRIAENGNNSGVMRNKSTQNNYRNRYSSNSAEGGKSRDQQTKHSSYTSEVGYRTDNAEIGNDLGIMRSRSRQNNHLYASNSAAGGESREQNYNTRYSGYTAEVGYSTRNNNRYATNSAEGGESREQNYNARHSGSTAEAGYRIRNAENRNDLGAMRSRNRKHNYRYSSNSAEAGYRTDNSEKGSRQNSYRNNRYSSNSAEGGESREQNHQLRYSRNAAEAGYRTRRNLGPMQNGREGRRVNRIGMNKDLNLDVYDMSVQQDGTYEFQAED